MHRPIVLPFFLEYLTNAEYILSCRPVTSKPTLTPIISSAYWVNLERMMFDRILYVVDKSDMPR
jgi:hypothetical protein